MKLSWGGLGEINLDFFTDGVLVGIANFLWNWNSTNNRVLAGVVDMKTVGNVTVRTGVGWRIEGIYFPEQNVTGNVQTKMLGCSMNQQLKLKFVFNDPFFYVKIQN